MGPSVVTKAHLHHHAMHVPFIDGCRALAEADRYSRRHDATASDARLTDEAARSVDGEFAQRFGGVRQVVSERRVSNARRVDQGVVEDLVRIVAQDGGFMRGDATFQIQRLLSALMRSRLASETSFGTTMNPRLANCSLCASVNARVLNMLRMFSVCCL